MVEYGQYHFHFEVDFLAEPGFALNALTCGLCVNCSVRFEGASYVIRDYDAVSVEKWLQVDLLHRPK